MSIFNMSNLSETKQETPEPTQQQEVDMSKVVAGTPTETSPTSKDEMKTPPKPVEIVLSGPLGHIYTQALNVLLAKEDAVSTYKFYEEYEREEDEEDKEGEDKAFVYIADGRTLEQGEVVRAFNDIVKFKNDYPKATVVVGLECAGTFSKAAASFDRCISGMKIPTFYKKDSITNAIKNLNKA